MTDTLSHPIMFRAEPAHRVILIPGARTPEVLKLWMNAGALKTLAMKMLETALFCPADDPTFVFGISFEALRMQRGHEPQPAEQKTESFDKETSEPTAPPMFATIDDEDEGEQAGGR